MRPNTHTMPETVGASAADGSPEQRATCHRRRISGRKIAGKVLAIVVGLAQFSFLLCFLALGLILILRHHYDAHLRPLLDHHRRNKVPVEGTRPNPNTVAQERMRTYYPRSCSVEDLTTRDYRDLTVPRGTKNDAVAGTAAEIVLAHGAAVFPETLDRNVADAFRNYTLRRNGEMANGEQVYVMNSKTGPRRTRWSFAFGGNEGARESYGDPNAVPDVLEAIAAHVPLTSTLEVLLGPDPAVVKMQTITAARGAEDQAWHPDVNARAGAASHARNFAMHLSLFVTLQDTTAKMGATGLCPGSQFCTEIDRDLEDGCIQVASGLKEENVNSTDRKPVWMAGDAVLMNQNTFHRGAEHSDRNGVERAIIVITFASRPRHSDGVLPTQPMRAPLPSITGTPNQKHDRYHGAETRVLGLGTPLSSFGFTLSDLQDPQRTMSRLWSPLRCYGLAKPSGANWGWDFFASLPGRVAAETHRLKRDDLSNWLREVNKNDNWWMWVCRRCFLMERVPASQEDRGIWDVWFEGSLEKGVACLRHWLTILGVASLLSMSAHALVARGSRKTSAPQRLTKFLGILALVSFFLLGSHWRIRRLGLIKDIRSGIKLRPPFPSPPKIGQHRRGFLLSDTSTQYNTGAFHYPTPAFVTPSRDDVLVGTRTNSLYLAGMNRFVDFHQGNCRWRQSMEGLDTRGLPSFWQEAIVSSIVNRQLKHGRFLYQSRDDGRFVELPRAEAQRFTRRFLINSSFSRVAELDRSVSFIVSHLLFESILRDTLLARVTAGYLDIFRERIFGEVVGKAPLPKKRVRRRKRAMFGVYTIRRNVVPTVPKYVAPEQKRVSSWNAAGSVKKKRGADPKRIIALNKRKKRARSK